MTRPAPRPSPSIDTDRSPARPSLSHAGSGAWRVRALRTAQARASSLRTALAYGRRRALDVFGTQACVLCNAPGPLLCGPCRAGASLDVAAACRRCAVPLHRSATARRFCGRCLKQPPAFDRTLAAAIYEAPFDQLIRGLKYRATLAYAPLFADLLHAIVEASVTVEDDDFDLLLPVPLSRSRMAERGFNQAVEIARALSRSTSIALDVDSVLRITDTLPQASLPFDERRANVRGAFAVIDARRERIAGRRIAVVDDVMTTGATLHELARTLKRAGAIAVTNLVVARTP